MTSKFPYLPLCVDAYRNDTAHLSLEEHGAYLKLLMLAWRSPGCVLPNDDARLALMLGVSAKKWSALKPSVMAFWVLANGSWSQGRLSKEHDYVSQRSEKRRAAGALGGAAKQLKNNVQQVANATPIAEASATANAQAPYTSHLTPVKEEAEPKGSEPETGSTQTDPRRDLFSRGVKEVRLMTGKGDQQCRTLIGKWLKDASDSAVIVMAAIDEAKSRELIDPLPWIAATLRREAQRNGSGSSDLFAGRSASGRHSPTQQSVIAAGVASAANRRGIRLGRGQDDPRSDHAGHRRSRSDDPEIPDAEWSPAERYRAAH